MSLTPPAELVARLRGGPATTLGPRAPGVLEGWSADELKRLRVDFDHLDEVADALDQWATAAEKAAWLAEDAGRPLYVGAARAFVLGDLAMMAARGLHDRIADKPRLAAQNLRAVARRLRTLARLVRESRAAYSSQTSQSARLVQVLTGHGPGTVAPAPPARRSVPPIGPQVLEA
jgi:hypothetical protein